MQVEVANRQRDDVLLTGPAGKRGIPDLGADAAPGESVSSRHGQVCSSLGAATSNVVDPPAVTIRSTPAGLAAARSGER